MSEAASKLPTRSKEKVPFFRLPWVVSILSSIISIFLGLFVGFIVLLCINAREAPSGFINMLKFGFTDKASVANIFYSCSPILMTGLAVAFAFKAGSFNIGGAGQFMGGATFAFVGAVLWHLPWPVCILLAIMGGAIVGSIPGLLKAFFNVNEVLSAILLNWIKGDTALMIVDRHHKAPSGINGDVAGPSAWRRRLVEQAQLTSGCLQCKGANRSTRELLSGKSITHGIEKTAIRRQH